MASEAVMSKIRALLAKEGAEGTTPQEVATALALAQRLLEREGLTRESLAVESHAEETEEIIKSDDPLFEAGAKITWKGSLAYSLAKENGVATCWRGTKIMMVGKPSNILVVRYLFAYCEREIQRITARHSRGLGKTWANNFRLGCVEAIRESIRAEKEAERAAQRAAASGSALVVLNQAIARMDQQFSDAYAFLRSGTRLRSVSVNVRTDSSARAAGRVAGASIYPGNGQRAPRIGAGTLRIGSGKA